MNTLVSHGKMILGFVSLVITNLLTNYANNATPLPIEDGQLDWGILLINLSTIVVGTYSVYQWDNKAGSVPAAVGRHAKPEA